MYSCSKGHKHMNSRERVLSATNHRLPDRVPLDLWARPEVLASLRNTLKLDNDLDVRRALGIDLVMISLPEEFPGWKDKAHRPLPGYTIYSGKQPVIFLDDHRFQDHWGVVRRLGQNGKYVEWVDGPLTNAQDPDEYDFPDPSVSLAQPDALRDQITSLQKDFCVFGRVNNPFKTAWFLRGMENLLCDLLVNRPFVEKLYQKIYDFETTRAVRFAQAGADVIFVVGDIAMQDRMLFQPEIWRDLDGPLMRKLVSEVRKVNYDIVFAFHSDGQMEQALPPLIDWGFSIINPIQPECMDPEHIKKQYGKQITLHGTMSIVNILPKGTPRQVRQATEQRIRTCGYNGGLILGPTNETQWDTPVENLLAMYEAAREFDLHS